MYSIDYRPQSLSEVVGIPLVKKIVTRVSLDPHTAPAAFVFEGPFGTGKTTTAQIFAKSLNCKKVKGDCCNVCDDCRAIDRFYFEYDSAIIGNVENIRSLRSSFFAVNDKYYRIVAFDEAHMISKPAQGGLLKLLEEAPKKTFFLFPTTNPDSLLETIRSRALAVPFTLMSDSDASTLIDLTILKQDKLKNISDEVREIAIRRARGHARDLMQQLLLYAILEEAEYISHAPLLDSLFMNLFSEEIIASSEKAELILKKLVDFPVAHIAVDLQRFLLNLSKSTRPHRAYESLLKLYFRFGRSLSSSLDYYLFLKQVVSSLRKKEQSQVQTVGSSGVSSQVPKDRFSK